MKKTAKKIISITLSLMMLLSLSSVALAAGDYTIVSPYSDVVWEGENAWGAYKGNLHSHTTYSDADVDLATMVKEYYNQDYDFLANADHGITGKAWNKPQSFLPLYAYQGLLGNKKAHLTDDEFVGITTGTYKKADGTARDGGMTCVVGANELNNLTLTKSHVNGYFLPEGVGDGFGGRENGFELAIAFVEKAGGLSHINHPGDFLESSRNIDAVSDKENVALFGELLLKYDSCLGIEVFNENNSVTPYDRILWDNLLMYCLPYGKNVIGFSNTDAHNTKDIDTSFSVFMMEENTVENVKETMQSGAFFAVTRRLKENSIIGPEKEIDARNTDIPYPVFTKVAVDGHTVSVKAENADTIQWIADGKVIAKESIKNGEYTLDLDKIEGAEDFTYVRAELFGKGGICLTQALVIDDGSAPLTYKAPTGLAAVINNIVYFIKSTLIWTIAVELTRL